MLRKQSLIFLLLSSFIFSISSIQAVAAGDGVSALNSLSSTLGLGGDENEILEILKLLENHEGLSIIAIQEQINLSYGNIVKVLKLLSVENPAPVIKQGSKYYLTPVKFKMDKDRIEFLKHTLKF